MISKIIQIHDKEGVRGLKLRLFVRLWALKLKIWKFLNRKIVPSYYGVNLVSNFDDATFKFYVCGAYGDDYWVHIKKQDKPFVFLDIGANQGLYTLCAASNKNCVSCFSFEPVQRTCELLDQNISINAVSEKCVVIKKAIASESCSLNISIASNHSGAATIHPKNSLMGESQGSTETIEAISHIELDKLINNEDKLRILVKIDVEGAEEVVISELMQSSIAENIEEIFFELDERWVDYNCIEGLLKKNGFIKFTKTEEKRQHYDVYATK